jgi:trk system potassium uptake protein TrkA
MRYVAVIGLGNFGSTVARELTEKGAKVIAIDKDRERVEAIKESVSYAAALDSINQAALQSVGIQDVDVAIVCIGDDIEANLLSTLLLKKIGVKRIWARAISPLQQEILRSLDVDEIVSLEEEMGRIVARSLVSPGVSKYISLERDHGLAEIEVPKDLVGRTIAEIDFRKKYHINIAAIRRRTPQIDDRGERTVKETFEVAPAPDEPLGEGDVLLLVGSDADIRKFSER